ncbi:integrin beta-1-like [Liolophura sinensis]|uniref:integrin beta-1-like n=1 Tax=Liolophura sinensis TaxID=3198878 RepID=UPI0031589F2B
MNLNTLIVLAVVVWCASGDPRTCRQQKTCGQCQAASPECAWCSDENYEWNRCDRRDYHFRCQRQNVVNHTSSISQDRARPIGGRVLISPQYLQAVLYKGRPAPIKVRVKVTSSDVRRRRISLRQRAVEGVTVTVSSDCHGFQASNNNCPRIRLGEIVEFTLTLTVERCQGRQRMRLGSPGARGRAIRVDITPKCSCDCESQTSSDDTRCSENGRFSCGECQCYRGWYGERCECSSQEGDPRAGCMASQNATRECSGRGDCLCGQCRCHTDSSERFRYYGRFCECNDFACPFHDGQMCGGASRGRCLCNRCICNDGWRGEGCELSADTASCRARNGQICNNHGLCLGGVCRCDGNFRGPTCEECPTCMGRCEELKNCVMCFGYQSGPLSRQQCNAQCSDITMNIVDVVNPDAGANLCSFVDDSDGSFFFFNYRRTGAVVVNIQRNKVFAGR